MNQNTLTSQPKSQMRWKFKTRLQLWIQRLAILILLLLLWELLSGIVIDPYWVSEPSSIFAVLREWLVSGDLLFHVWITLQETIYGFVLGAFVGGAAGIWLGIMKRLAEILDPFIMAVYSLPKVALAPLFILWLGIGIQMKIILAAVIVFFLVFFNTLAGVRNVDKDLIDGIKLMGASQWQLFEKVILPSALTWIFVGLKMSVPYALIGAIVGEIIASNRGVGYLIQYSAGQFDTAGVFAGLFVLIVISTLLNGLIKLLEKRYMRWKTIHQEEGSQNA